MFIDFEFDDASFPDLVAFCTAVKATGYSAVGMRLDGTILRVELSPITSADTGGPVPRQVDGPRGRGAMQGPLLQLWSSYLRQTGNEKSRGATDDSARNFVHDRHRRQGDIASTVSDAVGRAADALSDVAGGHSAAFDELKRHVLDAWETPQASSSAFPAASSSASSAWCDDASGDDTVDEGKASPGRHASSPAQQYDEHDSAKPQAQTGAANPLGQAGAAQPSWSSSRIDRDFIADVDRFLFGLTGNNDFGTTPDEHGTSDVSDDDAGNEQSK